MPVANAIGKRVRPIMLPKITEDCYDTFSEYPMPSHPVTSAKGAQNPDLRFRARIDPAKNPIVT